MNLSICLHQGYLCLSGDDSYFSWVTTIWSLFKTSLVRNLEPLFAHVMSYFLLPLLPSFVSVLFLLEEEKELPRV